MSAKEIYIGNNKTTSSKKEITGKMVQFENESYLKISNSDGIRPFFLSVVSDSNHWMFISSNGGLSAGRKNSESSLFPYYTDDKITESAEITGSKTIMHVNKNGKTYSADIDGSSMETTAQNIRAAFADVGVGAEVKSATVVTLSFTAVPKVDSSTTNISVSSEANALAGIEKLDDAIKEVNTQRSELGAISNRLNHTVNNLTNISSNLSAAKGGIEDADFALETTNLAKNQILQQASTAMLAQANASKQNVLSLLQG